MYSFTRKGSDPFHFVALSTLRTRKAASVLMMRAGAIASRHRTRHMNTTQSQNLSLASRRRTN
jgi:hypothetical protein